MARTHRVTDAYHAFGQWPEHACVVRYGGIGDSLQAASVFPELRAQGWKVAVNCDQSGHEYLREHPDVDVFFVQRSGQIPIEMLGLYHERMAGHFGKFINLTESIERTLLAWPGDPEYTTETASDRHARMNVNYLERTHDLAGVPHVFHPGFYASPREAAWARTEVMKLRRNPNGHAGVCPVMLFSLSGSSVHKAWPHMDDFINKVLACTPANIVLVGDDYCRILEVGWEKVRRVKLRSGRWSVRKTLAFAEQVDLVVGTETGVMNAVGLLDVPKVVLLSHSSHENLTKHWRNTKVISPSTDDVPCYPCHKLHYKTSTCTPAPESVGGALCAYSIDPDRVFSACSEFLEKVYEVEEQKRAG